jgi:hypothetical protein
MTSSDPSVAEQEPPGAITDPAARSHRVHPPMTDRRQRSGARTRLRAACTGSVPDRAGLLRLLLAQLVVGAGLGLVWLAWSPAAVSYSLDLGSGSPVVVPAESEAQIAADGRYVVLTAISGVVFALLAWTVLRRNRGRVALAALAAGSLLGSLLTLATGELLSGGHRSAPVNTAFGPPLTLHADAAVFVQALVAVLLYTLFAGTLADPGLGRQDDAPRPDATSSLVAEPSVADSF